MPAVRGVGDEVGLLAALGRAHQGRQHRAGDLKAGVRLHHGQVLVKDLEEAAEVGATPVAPGPLPLLDDGLDGSHRGVHAGDGLELGPAEQVAADLSSGGRQEEVVPPSFSPRCRNPASILR